VREAVTQPMLGQIRLQWWRENVAAAFGEGAVRRHPVVEALSTAIRERGLERVHFERMIDAREADFAEDPPPSLAALEAYVEDTSSQLVYLALEALGVRDPEAAEAGRHIGIAYALAGLLRGLPLLAASGQPVIPADIAARTGLNLDDHRELRGSNALRAAVAEIAGVAEGHLRAARARRGAVARAALPALLPAVVAGQSLKRLKRAGHDPFNPALMRRDPLQSWRLTAAALRRRF
jgi:NADH dehydrogenase [ubiquinone] 1 alpha subcomplex assembly factor 6